MNVSVESFRAVRAATEAICSPLEVEDFGIQTIPEVSPPKWHLAHTTWFFEEVFLKKVHSDYDPVNPYYLYLFNSYYESLGERLARDRRGQVSRPTVREVFEYRACVDERVCHAIEAGLSADQQEILEIGLQHEQQHQELLLMDIKHILASNLIPVAYVDLVAERREARSRPTKWQSIQGGIVRIGKSNDGFAFDNESPQHEVLLRDYVLSSDCVTNAEYLEFIEQQGYQRPEFWLSDGWNRCKGEKWEHPLYWRRQEGEWQEFTFSGWRGLDPSQAVIHISYFEAAAFAEWREARLPTEAEWEHACRKMAKESPDDSTNAPHPPQIVEPWADMFGTAWQWTQSAYSAYPGYEAFPGPLSEYNGKFMSNQMVLRGGCYLTPKGHTRSSYRNFFYPHDRWQVSGIRLARNHV